MGKFLEYLWMQKLWWLILPVAVLFVIGILLIIAQTSALAPFIYTLF